MKILIILFTVLLTLTGCQNSRYVDITDIRDLPEDYGHYDIRDQAIADGVVVTFSGATANSGKITEFLQSAAKGESAFMRTIYYTTEGDPIITDYEFDGEKYIVTYDNSRDSFGTYICPQLDYWPYAIFDGDRLWLSNWSDFHGDSAVDLENAGYGDIAEVILDSHANMFNYAEPESIDGIVFNFGWLPGGSHDIFTRKDSSIAAIEQSLSLLKPGGFMSLCVYYGRNNGYEERDAILDYIKTIDNRMFTVLRIDFPNRHNDPPFPIFIRKDNP